MIVAAHQPNFFPWIGYFDKMMKADLFVLVDHVQFERQSFQNRTMIKTPIGPRWITVPVNQRSRDERFLDKTIDNSRDGRLRWGRKMMLTLTHAYRSAEFFETYEPTLASLLDRPWEKLADINKEIISLCREALDIRTPIVHSADLNILGAKSEMVLNLCKAVGADVYLAGGGASRQYLDVEAFQRAGIEVRWQEFNHPRYPQLPDAGEFVERLSVLDLLLNCGARSAEVLKGSPAAIAR
ncbi:MAG: WbqC family protein [Elusimicrobia bacterium]|nr:WbqC family protein [Elusimicrobiota bacterium]